MKKLLKFILTIIIIGGGFFLIDYFKINSNKTDNNIVQISEESFRAIEKFGEIENTNQKSRHDFGRRQGVWENDRIEIYNYNQQIVLRKNYRSEGTVFSSVEFEYNKTNNLIKEREFRNGNLDVVRMYKYNNDGNLQIIDSHDSNGKHLIKGEYKYDSKGNNIEELFFGSDGKLMIKHVFEYDNRGNKIEAINSYDGFDNNRVIYTYDDESNLIEEKEYDKNGKLTGKKSFSYDKENNIVEEIIYGLKTDENDKWTYEYKYDTMNNWIERTDFSDNVPKYIVKRKIKYYGANKKKD